MHPIPNLVALLVSGSLLLSAAMTQDGALRVVLAKPPAAPSAQPIVGPTDHADAERRAKAEQRLLLLYFTAKW